MLGNCPFDALAKACRPLVCKMNLALLRGVLKGVGARNLKAELLTPLELGAPPDFEGITCSELGCDRRYGLEWDHVDPVANRGTTSKDNLDPKCGPHHWDKTERDRKAGKLKGRRKARGP